jgi:hypothetical protein
MKRALLALALLLVGCSSESPKPAAPESAAQTTQSWLEDVRERIGIDHTYFSGETGQFYIIETMGGGAALFDHDNDGDLDLYLTQGNVLDGAPDATLRNRLFEQNDDGVFVDRTDASGTGDTRYAVGVTTGDYDSDGHVDLYVTNLGRNTLYRNLGDGTFADVTESAGVGGDAFSACAEFADIDLDGDLDLFVTNYLDWTTETEKPCYSEQNRRDYCNPTSYDAAIADVLYRNEGDGTFVDISEASGIAAVSGTGLGVAIACIDGDDWPDIIVGNDGMDDRLWINQGDGTFVERGMELGCAVDNSGTPKASMGVELFDVDDDGDLDLLVTTLFRETDSFFLNENGVFVDATARFGLAADTRSFTRWGLSSVDLDNDGAEELYEATGRVRWQSDTWSEDDWLAEPNLLFTRNDRGRYVLVPDAGTPTPIIATAHGVASGDLDGDGGMDLVVVNKDAQVNVLHNVVANRGNAIVLDVRTATGAPAIGARVEIRLQGGRTITRTVRSGRGYASASDPRIHIGLGKDDGVSSVAVRWPTGETASFKTLPAGTVHILTPPDA